MLSLSLLVVVLLFAGATAVFRGGASIRSTQVAKRGWEAADAFVISGGAGGISLLELYMASKNHQSALDNLQRVFNQAIPEEVSPTEWATYFKQHSDSFDGTRGVVSAWVGSLAEEEAVALLNQDPRLIDHGITAHRFDSPNHEGTDIYFADANGNMLAPEALGELGLAEIQVKSYESSAAFLQQVRGNPEHTFMVNHEVYAELEAAGKLEQLEVAILDGGWSHAVLQEQAREVFNDMEEALDVAGNVPLVSLLMLGHKTSTHFRQLFRGQAAAPEVAVNIAADASRLVVAGAAFMGGAKAGAAVGTLIMPGVGTLVGSIIGGISASVAAGKYVAHLRDRWKYGDIVDAAERLGRRYHADLTNNSASVAATIGNSIFGVAQAEEALSNERALVRRYGLDDAYRKGQRPTPMAALLLRSVRVMEHNLSVAKYAVPIFMRRLCALVPDANKDSGTACYGVLGALAAMQSPLLVSARDADIGVIQNQTKSYPNHPFRLRDSNGRRIDEGEFLQAVAAESWEKALHRVQAPTQFRLGTSRVGWNLLFGGMFLLGSAVLLMAMNGGFAVAP